MAKEYKFLIDGQWRQSSKEEDIKNPFNNETIARVYFAEERDIEDAVLSSQRAFEITKKAPAYKRADILNNIVRGLEHRKEEFAKTITFEAGKPISDSKAEVSRAINTFQIASEEAKRIGGEVIPLDLMQGSENRFGIVRRFPIGPILGITPFNFPLNLVAHKVAPAIASGNTIILKPAPKTPVTALMLGELISEAGFPAGGLNIIPCSTLLAEKLVTDKRIKKLSFTGSAAVGLKLKTMAGMKKVTLELGGNAAVIIHSDADIDFAAKRCAIGAFSYAGQICISVQRLYVHEDIYAKFMDKFLANIRNLQSGDPMDESTNIGPMIDEGVAKRTEEWLNEAVKDGAKILLGGKRTGNFFEPTVLTNIKPSMKVCGEEVFAPLATVERYKGFDDAVAMVNHSIYGLQAGVFTRDIGKIFQAYNTLEVGGVIVNDIPTYRLDHMPYGGVKMSGFGREGIRYAMEEMTEMKLLAVNPGEP
ncbi:MAG TPA: aldehyde dehydrogenase family protein [Thermodesulfobacteriota bacterium]|nr:aldehyde dehydrogenase family protein [Thermodesulfobacteriota bacterium]